MLKPTHGVDTSGVSSVPKPIDFERIHLRKSRREDVPVIRDLLQDGFLDSPAWDLVELHNKHPNAESFVFECIAKLEAEEHSYLICLDNEIIGHLSMVPPGARVVPSTWDILRVAWSVPFRFGLRFTFKFLRFLTMMSDETDPYTAPLQPAAMFDNFVVKTELRGHGIGLHVLQEFVTKDRKRVFLIAQPERCVRLYERVGFRVVHQHRLRTREGRECPNFIMLFDADDEVPMKTAT